MLRRIYDKTIALAESRNAPWALAAVSFAESSFFPIPPDVMLAPMALARPERAWLYAGICTIASVLGGILGYAIGALLYDTVGHWLIGLYGYADKLEEFRALYRDWGHLVILIKGMTPIPYKLVTIASGLAGYSFFWFVVLSVITRGIRFALVAGLVRWLGPTLRPFVERHLTAVTVGFFVILIGAFMLPKLLF